MWIHLPSECCPSVPESAEWSLPSGSFWETCARSVTSSGTLRQPAYWQRAWKAGKLSPLRFGPMSAPSILPPGLASWIASLSRLPASPSVSPDSGEEPRMSGGFGLTSGVAFAQFDPVSSSLKTLPDLFGTVSPLSSTILPQAGMTWRGTCFRLRKRERRKSESGSLSWPTPDAQAMGRYNTSPGPAGPRPTPALAAKNWPTVTVNDSKNNAPPSQHERNTPPLNVAAVLAVKNWSTPSTDPSGLKTRDGYFDAGLRYEAKNWATATSYPGSNRGTKAYGSNTGVKHAEKLVGQAISSPLGTGMSPSGPSGCSGNGSNGSNEIRGLNPRFVERLQGYPDRWSDCSALETPLCRWLERMRSQLWRLVSESSGRRAA